MIFPRGAPSTNQPPDISEKLQRYFADQNGDRKTRGSPQTGNRGGGNYTEKKIESESENDYAVEPPASCQ